jgi:hypothetical protein
MSKLTEPEKAQSNFSFSQIAPPSFFANWKVILL